MLKLLIGILTTGLLIAALFWTAGTFAWVGGWLYVATLLVCHGVGGLCVWMENPELLRRRGEMGEGTKGWDKIILALFGLCYLAILIVAALDQRHGWSSMSTSLAVVGVSLYVPFTAGITWAMLVNPHFEKTVRIQHDRSHKVIDAGPYRFVRHPGYGFVIPGFVLCPPLVLGSWWSFLPAVAAVTVLIIRTALEDRMLRGELPGYKEYAQRVRYRLLPGVW